MRDQLRLCLTIAVLCAGPGFVRAQQTSAPAPAAADADTHTPAPPSKEDAEDESRGVPVAARSTRTLPADLPPNPPDTEELKKSGLTWKGEYEADNDGVPMLGPDGKPLPVLYGKKGKRIRSKVKVPKTHPLNIAAGTLTVDGWTGKARLNYDIKDLKFIYMSSPAVGTVIVSLNAFPGSIEEKNAFDKNTLTVKAGDHELQLTSDKPMAGKKSESAWVKVDPDFTVDNRFPVLGYGDKTSAPYDWPGAKIVKVTGSMDAPPLPNGMQPKLLCIDKAGKPCPMVKTIAMAPETAMAK